MQLINTAHALGSWPFPDATDAFERGEPTWFEISEEKAEHFLDVLPPKYFRGGFFVGEPSCDTTEGTPVHAAVVRIGTRHFLRECAINPASIDAATIQLRHALSEEPAR